jgi:hypothetical protein
LLQPAQVLVQGAVGELLQVLGGQPLQNGIERSRRPGRSARR